MQRCHWCGKAYDNIQYGFCSDKCKLKSKKSSKEYYDKNKEKICLLGREWHKKNKVKCNKRSKEWYLNNKEYSKELNKKYQNKNKEKIKIRNHIYYEKNKNTSKFKKRRRIVLKKFYIKLKNDSIRSKQYRNRNNIARKARLKTDPLFRLKNRFRAHLRHTCTRNNIERIHFDSLSYDTLDIKNQIENQFTKEMNWKNSGIVWDVGHRIPLSWFKNKKELINIGMSLKNIFPVKIKFNRYIQSNRFAFINNKRIYDKEEAIKALNVVP